MKEYIVAAYYNDGSLAYCDFVLAVDKSTAITVSLVGRSKAGINVFKVLQN